jgi:hypothetical protein
MLLALVPLLLAAGPSDTLIADALHRASTKDFLPVERALKSEVFVRAEVDGANARVTSAMLPAGWRVLDEAALQKLADQSKKVVAYVVLSDLSIEGGSATVTVGADIAVPASEHAVKLCCCSAEERYQRRPDGHWRFVERQREVCS